MSINLDNELRDILTSKLVNSSVVGKGEIRASCPFHISDNPLGSTTLFVSLEKGVYHCFSCGASGTLKSLMLLIAPEHKALIKYLPEAKVENVKQLKTKDYDNTILPESLLGLFSFYPESLVDKGFHPSTLKYFEIGMDREHERITFPIRDEDGNLVGISGRTYVGDHIRYKIYRSEFKKWGILNYRFTKAKILWNYHNVKKAISHGIRGRIVVVEGFKGCMWVHQFATPMVVATIGAGLSKYQAKLLEDMQSPIILAYDGDEAGVQATLKAGHFLSKFVSVGVAIRIGKSPDDYSEKELINLLENPEPFAIWRTKHGGHERLFENHPRKESTPKGRAREAGLQTKK
jgi:DNA primase